mmetsp:Transcript_28938/g.43047  ORF Transcript_28938/g.43047 Transcript_28938/m.43047 type:complete len:109 (-) Transcript_28938:50-376(-)
MNPTILRLNSSISSLRGSPKMPDGFFFPTKSSPEVTDLLFKQGEVARVMEGEMGEMGVIADFVNSFPAKMGGIVKADVSNFAVNSSDASPIKWSLNFIANIAISLYLG